MNGIEVQIVDNSKFLGVTLSKELKWHLNIYNNIINIVHNIYNNINILLSKGQGNSFSFFCKLREFTTNSFKLLSLCYRKSTHSSITVWFGEFTDK